MKKALFILGQLDDRDVEWMIANGRPERVRAGHVLIRQGAPIDALYLVLDGRFSVVEEGLGREVAQLGSGEVVGEMSFVDARPPSASVRAAVDGQVLALPRAMLAERLERDPAFAARFYRALAMFLSDRLRATVRTLGYGEPARRDTRAVTEEEQEDELDLNVLDTVHLAGTRFEQIVRRVTGHHRAPE